MSDRSALTNLCLLGILIFMVLSSGVLQCAYNCIEEDASRRASSRYEVPPSSSVVISSCHLSLPKPKQAASCPNRSCHQNQAASRSLGEPVLTNHTDSIEPLLSGFRLPMPDIRTGQPLIHKTVAQPPLIAYWQAPTTTPQSLLIVKSTVLLN